MLIPSELIRSFIGKASELYPTFQYGFEINRDGAYRIWHTNPDENSDEVFQSSLSVLMYDMLTLEGFDDYYLDFNIEAYNSHCFVESLSNIHQTSSEVDKPTISLGSPVKMNCDNELVYAKGDWVARLERQEQPEPLIIMAA